MFPGISNLKIESALVGLSAKARGIVVGRNQIVIVGKYSRLVIGSFLTVFVNVKLVLSSGR
jgi:hypothetical protein